MAHEVAVAAGTTGGTRAARLDGLATWRRVERVEHRGGCARRGVRVRAGGGGARPQHRVSGALGHLQVGEDDLEVVVRDLVVVLHGAHGENGEAAAAGEHAHLAKDLDVHALLKALGRRALVLPPRGAEGPSAVLDLVLRVGLLGVDGDNAGHENDLLDGAPVQQKGALRSLLGGLELADGHWRDAVDLGARAAAAATALARAHVCHEASAATAVLAAAEPAVAAVTAVAAAATAAARPRRDVAPGVLNALG
mmetsp:Transcript_13804/g.44143  ORF Transcript_13804/g.44143 Transcript_13804/m.44143 type:complete len:252 (-) Transcript_13804:1583-2338(-)